MDTTGIASGSIPVVGEPVRKNNKVEANKSLQEQCANTEQQTVPSSEAQMSIAKETESKKCKETETKSAAWEYFERVKDKDSNSKAKCIYCSKKLGIDTCKHGTSSIRNHILSCKKIPHDMSTRQTLLAFQTIGSTDKEGVVGMVGA